MADFGSIDANGDGQLSYDEVKAAATKVARAHTPSTHWLLLCARSQLLARTAWPTLSRRLQAGRDNTPPAAAWPKGRECLGVAVPCLRTKEGCNMLCCAAGARR